MNDFFRDQTLLDDGSAELPEIDPYPFNENLISLTVTPEEVELTLEALPVEKSYLPGWNKQSYAQRNFEGDMFPTCCIFNHSFRSGEVPDAFKESHVCSVPQGYDPAHAANCRPIALLSNLDKH